MLKLYKTVKGRVAYWEAWQANTKIVVHTGWLGHWGKQVKMAMLRGESEKKAIARLAAPIREAGYAPIADEDHKMLVIQKSLETWGTSDDLDVREAIFGVANEWLGWTGNGRATGGDVGTGTANVFCLVLDPACAVKTLVIELRKARLLEDVTIAYSKTDALRNMTIGYPEGSKKRFSILGRKRK